MRPMMLLTLSGLLLAAVPALAGDLVVGRFSAGDLSGWEVKEFKGNTQYAIVSVDGRKALHAVSNGTASGLFKAVAVDLAAMPILRWSWKVKGVVKGGDARRKQGDDYAARVYVVFPGTFFWQTRSITYIWANRLPKGQAVPNAFTGKAMMIAVRSGPEQAGRWLSEERNVYQDFRRMFGEDPPLVGAVAVMTDSDNTGAEAEAWFGDISFSPAP